jgi:hypothetical protein
VQIGALERYGLAAASLEDVYVRLVGPDHAPVAAEAETALQVVA